MPMPMFASFALLAALATASGDAQEMPPTAQGPVEHPLPAQPLRIGRGDANSQGNRVAMLCVDRSQEAWLLVYGVLPQDRERACAKPGMQQVPRAQAGALCAQLRRWIRHDSYPAADAAGRVVTLALQEPGLPVGLTWDGGMAITANDYRDAKRRLAAYRADPQGYAMKHWNGEF